MNGCNPGQHNAAAGDLYCYTDIDHGIARDTWICRKCLYAHAKKYYPGGATERSIKALFPDTEK